MIDKCLMSKRRKLDNAAKIFSLQEKDSKDVFRISVKLLDNVNFILLKKALLIALEKYPFFKVKLKSGMFWNYFVRNKKEPLLKHDNEGVSYFKDNNDYLFKLSYYEKQINLDFFHVLTDGNGALKFLKEILYNYLDLYDSKKIHKKTRCFDISGTDPYIKCFDKTTKVRNKIKMSYQFEGVVKKNINNESCYSINLKDIKKVCKIKNVSVTEYLTALYIYAIYLSIYNKQTKKEIVITIPVDLHQYYDIDTLANFFVCMNINSKIIEKGNESFDEILNEVHSEFREKLKRDKIRSVLARDVRLGKSIVVNLMPLFLKKIIIKLVGPLINRTITSTVSNVGNIDFDGKYKGYVENVFVSVLPNKFQKIKCTICSFDNNLNIMMNSNIDDLKFEKTFCELLKSQVRDIRILKNSQKGI